MSELTPNMVLERYQKAKERRGVWESHWQECYDFALPQRSGFLVMPLRGKTFGQIVRRDGTGCGGSIGSQHAGPFDTALGQLVRFDGWSGS